MRSRCQYTSTHPQLTKALLSPQFIRSGRASHQDFVANAETRRRRIVQALLHDGLKNRETEAVTGQLIGTRVVVELIGSN